MFKITSLLLSLVLALPTQGMAAPSQQKKPTDATNAIEAVLISLPGVAGSIVIAPISSDLQAPILNGILNSQADTAVIGISGEGDPALQTIANNHNFAQAHIALASRPEDIPALNENLPRSFRQRVIEKIKFIRNKSGLENVGLLMSYVGAVSTAGATFYASGSYLQAGGLLGVLLGFTSYKYFFSDQWNAFRKFGHGAMVGLAKYIAKKSGTEMSDSLKKKLGVSGEFHAAWLANSAVATTVMLMTSAEASWQIPLQALIGSFLANPDVWDHTIKRYQELNTVTERFLKNFIWFRVAMITLLDGLIYLQVINSFELILGFITMSGMIWFLAGDRVDREIASRLNKRKMRRQEALSKLMANPNCKKFLAGKEAS